ncbi:hypothetical protein, partial [Pseudomonas orientalis]|uniref:hypothetical protein n=1 Tax=Pseudomonas orientalis TaxID=76758 RepID=UPI0034D6966E
RGLTGRLRSKADQDQERLASHRGYGWALLSCVDTYAPEGGISLPPNMKLLSSNPTPCDQMPRFTWPAALLRFLQ